MEFKAKLSYIRRTPRKMGLLADDIRGKNVNEALHYLQFSPRKQPATLLIGLIKSAIANADRKGTVDVDKLRVSTILVGKGPTLKRWRARAKGSAFPIKKRTSHVYVSLTEHLAPLKVVKTAGKPAAKKADQRAKQEK